MTLPAFTAQSSSLPTLTASPIYAPGRRFGACARGPRLGLPQLRAALGCGTCGGLTWGTLPKKTGEERTRLVLRKSDYQTRNGPRPGAGPRRGGAAAPLRARARGGPPGVMAAEPRGKAETLAGRRRLLRYRHGGAHARRVRSPRIPVLPGLARPSQRVRAAAAPLCVLYGRLFVPPCGSGAEPTRSRCRVVGTFAPGDGLCLEPGRTSCRGGPPEDLGLA